MTHAFFFLKHSVRECAFVWQWCEVKGRSTCEQKDRERKGTVRNKWKGDKSWNPNEQLISAKKMWLFVSKVLLYIQAAQRPVKEKKKKNQVFHLTPKFHAWIHEAHAWRKASYRSCDSRRVSWVHQRGWSRWLQLQSGPQRPSLLSGRQGEARGWCCRRNLSRPIGKHNYSV